MEQEPQIGKVPERKITVRNPKTGVVSVFNRDDSDAGMAGELIAELDLEIIGDNQSQIKPETPTVIDRLTGKPYGT